MAYYDRVLLSNPSYYFRFNESSGGITVDDIQGGIFDYNYLENGVITQQSQGLINDTNFSVHLFEAYTRGIIPFNYSNSLSMELWFKSDPVINDNSTLATNYFSANDWTFRLRTINFGGQLVMELNTTRGIITIPASGININDGGIYSVVASYDGSTVLLYVNGLQRGIGLNITLTDSFSDVFVIGNEYNGNTDTQYNGFVDEISLYNYTLLNSDIQDHYSAGINPPVSTSKGGKFASLIDVSSFQV